MMKVTANGKTFTFPDGTSTEDKDDWRNCDSWRINGA